MTPFDDDSLSHDIRDALAPTAAEVARLTQRAYLSPRPRTALKLALAAAVILAAVALWPRGSRVQHLVVEEVDGFLVVHGREGSRGFVSRTGKRPQIGSPVELLNDERRRP